MPIIPNLSAHRPRMWATSVPSDFVAWPYVDSLYDYTQVLGSPLATLPSETIGTKVAVIGAGPGGIVAALELLRIGLIPVIYEGSGRIGGRNWSELFNDGVSIAEMGAMRVPVENKVFYYYANLLNMQPSPFPDPGTVQTTLYCENQAYPWAPGDPPPGPFRAIHDEFNAFVTPLLDALWVPWSQGNMAAVQAKWQEYIDKYSMVSFYEGVQAGTNWNQQQMTLFGALGMGSGGFGPLYDITFLDIFRLLAMQLETDQQLFAGGISELTNGMYTMEILNAATGESTSLANVGALYPAYATSLTTNSNGWAITDNSGITQDYPAVVLAITTREMSMLGFTLASSPLQQDVQTAIRDLHMMESSKLFIRTATKFWLDDPSMPANIQTDQLPRGVYCLDYAQTDSGVVLISYTWGDDSAKLMAMDKRQRFELLKSTIATIDPTFASFLEPVDGEILNVDWQLQPFYWGAFKLNLPGQEASVQAAYFQFLSALDPATDPGIYLAGDGVSWTGGWTEGALHTGLNAAAAVAQHLNATPIANGPMTQRPLYTYPPATSS